MSKDPPRTPTQEQYRRAMRLAWERSESDEPMSKVWQGLSRASRTMILREVMETSTR
jgi:hypothetical protein